MKNKIICLLLAVIMCLSCLAACNGGGGDDAGNGDGTGSGSTDTGNTNTGNTDDGDDDGEDDGAWYENLGFSETNVIFKMTNHTQSDELSSEWGRYLAGNSGHNDAVDTLVRTRNENAYKYTKVKVSWDAYPDLNDAYSYSNARTAIMNEIDQGGTSCPDMWSNYMTDLLLVALKGKFANLNTQDTAKYGKNHFNINLTKDAEENQYGYMTDLMRSLTLNTGKIYVIASDYFIDLIRAFFVVPVNTQLFNTIAQTADPALTNLDNSADGLVDINDFMVEVEQKGWTYDRLIQYSNAAYRPHANLADRVYGFALGKNGLPAAGLIYTSGATVITRDWSDTHQKDVYAYPENNPELANVISEISDMMKNESIVCMDNDDARELGYNGTNISLLGIRHKFTNGSMLFGGIILVGSIENSYYQAMKNTSGGSFAVVPVPMVTNDKNGDGTIDNDYLTQIHSVGRAGAITAKTTKFSQCSAYIQYQTENSTEILNHYYNYNLCRTAASGVAGNYKMLQYIRNRIRTSFDKLFEDAIGFNFDDTIDESARFHSRLQAEDYDYVAMFEHDYETYYSTKTKNLSKLEELFYLTSGQGALPN